MWRILILANIRRLGFHAVVVFGLGKELLFKYVLERCRVALIKKKINWFPLKLLMCLIQGKITLV